MIKENRKRKRVKNGTGHGKGELFKVAKGVLIIITLVLITVIAG